MGFVTGMGHCFSCHQVFAFNPKWVPSLRVNGEREPICRMCIEAANVIRVSNGDKEHFIHPQAYEAMHEEEL